MKTPRIIIQTRPERWLWLRKTRGLSQIEVIQRLNSMGCSAGKNFIYLIEKDPAHRISQEVLSCLAYIYNYNGTPANINWILNGLEEPFLKI